MDQRADDDSDASELIPTGKVMNFSQFWEEQESQEPRLSNADDEDFGFISTVQSNITMTTSKILFKELSNIAFAGLIGYAGRTRSKEESIKEFSQEVSDYAVSKEVIVQLSNEIGPPHIHENEDQFVERAKQVMKQILKKKFCL
jgi:hypothetical protein